ncbi:MAG: flagella synthesis protein FlgN [Azonexus sp.]
MSDTGEKMPSELAGQLNLGIALLEKLRELLARETAILASGGHEQLIGLAEDKQRLVVRLIDLSKVLFDDLIGAGYSPDGKGLARCIQESPGSDELAGAYDTAMTALRACAVYNQTNGSLLERRRAAVNRALRILFDHPDGGSRYYSSGRLEGLNPNRLIGEA